MLFALKVKGLIKCHSGCLNSSRDAIVRIAVDHDVCLARFSVCGSHMATADPKQNGTK